MNRERRVQIQRGSTGFRSRGGRWMGHLALLAVLVGSTVAAQGRKSSVVKFRKASQLSAAEQRLQARKYIAQIKVMKRRTAQLAKKARADKDLIKLNCIQAKRTIIKVNLKLAEDANGALVLAAARGDAGERSHQFSKLTINYQNATVAGQEAEACVGEEISYTGKAKITVFVDPDVARQGDPTVEPPPPLPTIRPPLASPRTP